MDRPDSGNKGMLYEVDHEVDHMVGKEVDRKSEDLEVQLPDHAKQLLHKEEEEDCIRESHQERWANYPDENEFPPRKKMLFLMIEEVRSFEVELKRYC